jgi:hypothetical protein
MTIHPGTMLNRSITRQRCRTVPSLSNAQPSHVASSLLNRRPYSAKYAPVSRAPPTFASEAYHEREVPGKPYAANRHLTNPSIATTETPTDLTPEQRKIIERTLRVDLVGEGAANWIYQATKFVTDLKGDKETSKKVEVSITLRRMPTVNVINSDSVGVGVAGNVADGTPSPPYPIYSPETTSRPSNGSLSCLESRLNGTWRRNGDDGPSGDHGVHRGD